MIPEFDQNGNLPVGIHRATLQEVAGRFGPRNLLRRQRLTSTLVTFCNAIEGDVQAIFIDGSYITGELNPGDVDLMVILRPDSNLAAFQKIQRFQQHRKKNKLHIFVFISGRQDRKIHTLLSEWTHDIDRGNLEKGIIQLETDL